VVPDFGLGASKGSRVHLKKTFGNFVFLFFLSLFSFMFITHNPLHAEQFLSRESEKLRNVIVKVFI